MSDIPRAEVERVLEELHAAEEDAAADRYFVRADIIQEAIQKVEALLKPKQYKVEWWEAVALKLDNGKVRTYIGLSGYGWTGRIVARRPLSVPPLEHGEGIE